MLCPCRVLGEVAPCTSATVSFTDFFSGSFGSAARRALALASGLILTDSESFVTFLEISLSFNESWSSPTSLSASLRVSLSGVDPGAGIGPGGLDAERLQLAADGTEGSPGHRTGWR